MRKLGKNVLLLFALTVTLSLADNRFTFAADAICGGVENYMNTYGQVAHSGEGQGYPWESMGDFASPVWTHWGLLEGYWEAHYTEFPFGPWHSECS